MNDTALPPAALTSTLVNVEDITLPDAHPYAALGIGGGLPAIGLAGLAAYLGWPDIVAYLFALIGLFVIIGGIVAASRQDERRVALAKIAIATTPTAVLAHATLDLSLSEKTRVLIANHLNQTEPDWHTRLDSESEDWQSLKAAGATMSTCFRSCGGSSGAKCK
jgi:hypothetical protein